MRPGRLHLVTAESVTLVPPNPMIQRPLPHLTGLGAAVLTILQSFIIPSRTPVITPLRYLRFQTPVILQRRQAFVLFEWSLHTNLTSRTLFGNYVFIFLAGFSRGILMATTLLRSQMTSGTQSG